jgi:hypothetical protein
MVGIWLGYFVNTQIEWYDTWRRRLQMALGEHFKELEVQSIVEKPQRDSHITQEEVARLGIVRNSIMGRHRRPDGRASRLGRGLRRAFRPPREA